ncbi:BnaCnng56970D, partial [Brassica napus]
CLGLKNLRNTYFLNSVSQFLTYTECLDAYFLDVGNVKRFHVTGFCALCAMQRHVRTALQAPGRIAAPSLKLWRAHRFHLRQEISALAGSSLRNERSHISCHCQKS